VPSTAVSTTTSTRSLGQSQQGFGETDTVHHRQGSPSRRSHRTAATIARSVARVLDPPQPTADFDAWGPFERCVSSPAPPDERRRLRIAWTTIGIKNATLQADVAISVTP
jgi:hypothetical protein